MKKIILMGIAASLALAGCSSTPEESKEVQAPTVEAETTDLVESDANDVAEAPVMMPFQIKLVPGEAENGVLLTVELDYLDELGESTTLNVELGGDAQIVDGAVSWFNAGERGQVKRSEFGITESIPPVSSGSKVVRQFVVSGEEIKVNVRLGVYADGLAIEMHESWPEKKIPQKSFNRMKPLEHPVEINGVLVDQSVEIRPR